MAAAKVYADGQALASSVSRKAAQQNLVERSVTHGSRVAGIPTQYAGFLVTVDPNPDAGMVAVRVTVVPHSSDRNYRREEAAEWQTKRTEWLRGWLYQHAPSEWDIGPIQTDRFGDDYFLVSAVQGYR